ncbi:uncharacterized protein LOC143281438 [Babylonia areolata]|uniref:uncharacterized protein LOC143281438 n=1 Tax=Babylonia areolata TaxID=304850 RepID=UPI003FD5A3C6
MLSSPVCPLLLTCVVIVSRLKVTSLVLATWTPVSPHPASHITTDSRRFDLKTTVSDSGGDTGLAQSDFTDEPAARSDTHPTGSPPADASVSHAARSVSAHSTYHQNTQDNTPASTLQDESTQDNSPTSTLQDESTQDNSPTSTLQDESTQDNSPTSTLQDESTQDNSPTSTLQDESTQDNSPTSTLPHETSSTSSGSIAATFQSHVVLETQFLRQCFTKNENTQYHALHLEVLASYDKDSRIVTEAGQTHLRCHVDLIVPEDMVVKVQVVNFTSRCDNVRRLYVVESQSLVSLVDVCRSTTIAGEFSLTNRVSVKVSVAVPRRQWNPKYDDLLLHLNLTAVSYSDQLEVHYASRMTGIVQTPRWNGQVNYPYSMNSRAVVRTPAHHHVMLSFYSVDLGPVYNCQNDMLRVFAEEDAGHALALNEIEMLCGDTLLPAARVHKTSGLYFVFRSNTVNQFPGFRALFSFHNVSSTPQQTAGGQWNCTVPHWPQFSQHFPCNLESNCINSEDEVECDYITAGCGQGVITAGDGCYVFWNLGQDKQTYRMMKEWCEARGGSLASLNTVQEWEDVYRMLHQGHWKRVLVGLQPVPDEWPYMYNEMFCWADGSVAYYTLLEKITKEGICAYFARSRRWLYRTACYDDIPSDKHVLCELDPPQAPPLSHTLPLPHLARRPVQGRQVRCPSGHMTHNFLSCDVDSQCWADPTSTPASCQLPMESLPPVFACSDGTVEVPYTLVCDHRHDCSDGSDEVFCFFPPCATEGDFRCDNGQCVSEEKVCDGQIHCLDSSHKRKCFKIRERKRRSKPPPRIVGMDQHGSGVEQVSDKGFQPLPQLQVMDIRGCSMTEFPRGLMENMKKLRLVFADNYKLCCPAVLPAGFPQGNCHAPSDEISSCDTLLRSDFFRLFLYVFAVLGLIVTSHWEFYKQSSICLPLPVTRQYFKGQAYSFSVMVVLNFILFLLIAVGQAFIYYAIRTNSMSMVDSSKSSSKELTIARRLITVAMSDFLCWFPIGFLGLLASQNMAIPGEVRVGLAIFVLPLNSALNPFLYTLNVIREKRKQAYFKKLQGLFQSQQQIKTTDVSVSRHQ